MYLLDNGCGIFGFENRAARNDDIGACFFLFLKVFRACAAAHLDFDVPVSDELFALADLIKGFGNERLSAESRVHAHNDNDVDNVKVRLDHRQRFVGV